jgi:peptidylprolyl isomerase
MGPAKEGDTVRVHYEGRFEDGEVFDTSEGREPMEFVVGQGAVIPGFERAVIGMTEGETKTQRVEPEDAYGQRREELMLEVPKDQFPPDVTPRVGQRLLIQAPDGMQGQVTVAQIGDETVMLDANHPLAGRTLLFDIRLVQVMPGSEASLTEGAGS